MQTVTVAQIREAMIAAIHAIVPTCEALRDAVWSYTPSPRKDGRALLPRATRNFDIILGAGVPSYVFQGGAGTAYRATVNIATSYAGVEPDVLEVLVTEDSVDLRRALSQLRDPTVSGLANVIATGYANPQVDDEANSYIEHAFVIDYNQSTD